MVSNADLLTALQADMQKGKGPRLHKDLKARLLDTAAGTQVLNHPLVLDYLYHPVMHRMYNAQYEARQAAVQRHLEEENWEPLLYMYARPWRLLAFDFYACYMSDSDYWHNLGWIYRDSENLDQLQPLVVRLLSSTRKQRKRLMTAGDRRMLDSLPRGIRVYKGFPEGYDYTSEFSFTTNINTAVWFAQRFGSEHPRVLTGRVPKSKVLAYMNDRGEHEILVDPRLVTVDEIKPVPQAHLGSRSSGAIFQTLNRLPLPCNLSIV